MLLKDSHVNHYPVRKNRFLHLVLIVLLYPWGHLLADSPGFLSVSGPCNLTFPEDHGAHPGFRTEWWYYTGNLESAQGKRFGYQLTFFRRQITSPDREGAAPPTPSAWRTDQIYLAHAALSDLDGGTYHTAEQAARAALGMAGSWWDGDAFTVVLKNWKARITPGGHHLRARTPDFSLEFELKPEKPPVLHGDSGYSRKGSAPDQASCYYSLTRLDTAGWLTLGGQKMAVTGESWMDQEFSTAPLAPGITGWDWFGLQLSNGTEVMIYLLRREDRTLHPASSGTFIDPEGRARHLKATDFQIEVDETWQSPHSGALYPSAWRFKILPLELNMQVTSNLADQEMRSPESTGVTYWEGSISIRGAMDGEALTGRGYAELTGYAEAFDAPM